MSKSVTRKAWARPVAALLACTLAAPLWAAPADIAAIPAPMLGSDPPKAKDIRDGEASVSTQTGALSYAYPISVPPGRMGMEPKLALSYSSQGAVYGGIADHWSLSIPEIRLDTSESLLAMTYYDGLPSQLPSWQREKWVSTLSGGRPLVPVTEPAGVAADVQQAYRAQNDDSYVRYERINGGAYKWRARGTNGLTYYFGETSLVSGPAQYVIPLTSTEDRYGNRIEYQWADQQLVEVRYTSNPAAGLPAFAKVQFDYVDEFCAATDRLPVGAAENAILGVKEGRRKLTKIRAIAVDSGGVTQHTREYTLGYDAAAASCSALHGPQRLLTSIRESAWQAGQAHVDLPAVTFTYNRLERAFDDSRTQVAPWASFWTQGSTSTGERASGKWNGVRAMMLDFDGDGLQDRIESYDDPAQPDECKFVWAKNLGRDPGGMVSFEGFSAPITMPRLPWKNGTRGQGEKCFLNHQMTLVRSGHLYSECTDYEETHLAYRWLDLNSDGRVDLVAAIHQDFHFDASQLNDPLTGLPFYPDLFTKLKLPGTQWPLCAAPLPDGGAGRRIDSTCVMDRLDCTKPPCTIAPADIAQCVAGAPHVPAGWMAKGASGNCSMQSGCITDPKWVDPVVTGAKCGEVRPHEQCDRYPWFFYANTGKPSEPLPPMGEIKYEPVPLESENGDSPAAGGGAVFSESHVVTDLDADGFVDVAVRGAYASPPWASPNWWLVYRGDGTGQFHGFQGNDPYLWLAPNGFTGMGSCAHKPFEPLGAECDPLEAGALPSNEDRDLRGHTLLVDLNGDGTSDAFWSFRDPGEPRRSEAFFNDGRHFPSNSATGALGQSVGQSFGTLSRSYLDVTSTASESDYMATGTKYTLDRLVDIDGDGRVDLVRTWPGPYTTTTPEVNELFINSGGSFRNGVTIPAPASGNFMQLALRQVSSAISPGWWSVTTDYVDLDGDGKAEGWAFTPGAPSTATVIGDKDTQPLRLLKAVTNGRGATVTITYAPTTDATTVTQDATFTSDTLRKAIPNVQWVVKSMSTYDQWDADVSTTSYAYKHPIWAKDDRGRWGFRGFEEVTTTLPPAASGSAKSVDTYDYSVDWSGRLAMSRKYSAEEPANPRTISETTWAAFTLFGGAIKTYHATHQQSWTCNNGQSEATCTLANAGYVWKYSIWTALQGQLWVEDNTYTMDGPGYNAGDRRSYQGYVLYSTPTAYQVQQQTLATLLANNSDPAQDTWTNYVETYFDSAYKQPTFQQQFFAVNATGTPDYTTRAITTWTYDPATGVRLTTQNPRNNPSGPVESYGYDANKRFVTSTTNEFGHVVTATYEPGTGAQLTKEGPNGTAPNIEKSWTDVDGIGRPVATYVNHAPVGGGAWQKTLVAKMTYTDAIAGGARTKVVAESLIDWGGFRWTREETRLDGKGRPAQVIVKTGGLDAITTYDYDKTDHLVAVSLPDPTQNSAATVTYTYAYDSLGRPIRMRRPGAGGAPDSGVNMSYDGQTSQTDEVAGALGGVQARKVLINDHFGRLVEVREYTSTAGVGSYASTFYQYDGGDRVTRIQNPDTVITQLFHDFAGRRVKITRGSRNWIYTYLKDGQLESETVPGPAGTTTNTYAYDAAGRLKTRLVGSRGMASGPGTDGELFGIGTTTFTYDTCTNGKARLCTVTLPNSRLITAYAYDSEGNTTDVTRTFNVGFATNWSRTTSAAYGPGGKLVTQKYADEANGQTVKTTATYNYDDRANPAVLSWTPAALLTTTPPTQMTARTVANQTRNVAGLVTKREANLSATSGWKNFASDFTYDALTRVASQTVRNVSASSQLAKQQLDYFGTDDPARLRHWMGTTAYDFTYGYDLLHELTSVSEAAVPAKYSATFAYGVNGTSGSGKFKSANVQTVAGLAGSQVTPRNVSYDYTDLRDPEEPTGLTDVGTGNRLRSYVYDDAGNQTEVHSGAVASPPKPTTRFVYDGDDQLRRATTFTPGTTTPTGSEEYYYDHDGHRVGVVTRNAAGTITKTRLFIGDSEVELTAANTIGTAYSYLSMGTPVAKLVSPTGGWTAGSTSWANNVASVELQYHGLSSNTLVSVNAGGVVQSAFVYAPYGEVVQAGGATTATIAGQRRRFNDKFRDDLTGLSYYGVRYYDGLALGWTQADPMYRFAPDAAWAEPRRAGLYQFDLGNPVRYEDPDGRCPGCLELAAEEGEAGVAFVESGGLQRLSNVISVASQQSGDGIARAAAAVAATGAAAYAAAKAELFGAEGTIPMGPVMAVPKPPTAGDAPQSKTQPDVTDTTSPTPEPPGCGPSNPVELLAEIVSAPLSAYNDASKKDTKIPNKSTDVTRANFESNLRESGFTSTTTPDGAATRWTGPDGQTYTIRDKADSHGGPTADFRKCGPGGKPDAKIRLPE